MKSQKNEKSSLKDTIKNYMDLDMRFTRTDSMIRFVATLLLAIIAINTLKSQNIDSVYHQYQGIDTTQWVANASLANNTVINIEVPLNQDLSVRLDGKMKIQNLWVTNPNDTFTIINDIKYLEYMYPDSTFIIYEDNNQKGFFNWRQDSKLTTRITITNKDNTNNVSSHHIMGHWNDIYDYKIYRKYLYVDGKKIYFDHTVIIIFYNNKMQVELKLTQFQ